MSSIKYTTKKNKIALVDCNSFYVSCERLFNPKIQKKAVVVLSNNDGCVISRSREAKDLGIKIKYIVQSKPRGLPDAFILSQKFIHNESVAMILGDNFFYGNMLSPIIKRSFKKTSKRFFILRSSLLYRFRL